MPLRDHFHAPLSERRHWHSFLHAWATYLAADLNHQLPENYFAEANVQYGIEIDVATMEESPTGGQAPSWSPAKSPVLTVPMALVTDVIEVQVFKQEGGPILAGAMELVSPANKDRPETRAAFVSKCASYLQQGIGLIVIDIVTERKADLHGELVHRIYQSYSNGLTCDLWAAAYRPATSNKQTMLEIWQETLIVSQPLPALPLWLKNGPCMKVDLEATYEHTCRENRVFWR